MSAARVALGLAVSLAIACGGSTSSTGGGGGGGGNGSGSSGSGSSGSGSSGGSEGPGVGPCPATAPTAGSSCSSLLAGIGCEYGDDPDLSCNTLLTCTQGTWTASGSAAQQTCPTPAATGACPATYAAAQAAGACSQRGLACGYTQGRCDCAEDTGGPPTVGGANVHWLCDDAPSGCPSPRPHVGAACSGAQTCNYGACNIPDGVTLVCTSGGAWQTSATACAL